MPIALTVDLLFAATVAPYAGPGRAGYAPSCKKCEP